MKVVCKTTDRKEFSVELEPTETLQSLFQNLKETYGIDPEKSSLIFSGQILHDLSKTLEDIKYKQNDWFVLFNRSLKSKVSNTKDNVSDSSVNTSNCDNSVNGKINSVNTSNTSDNRGDSSSDSSSNSSSNSSSSSSDSSSDTNSDNDTSPNKEKKSIPTVRISQEAVENLLEIIQNDPNCSRLIKENPSLMLRITDPNVLVNLANMIGLDLSKFVRKEETSEGNEPNLSDTIWPSPTYNVPILPLPPRPSKTNERKVLKLSAAEARVLAKIKTDLMAIIGELPDNINEYQINTIIHECYIAADKNPEIALNILIDHMLEHIEDPESLDESTLDPETESLNDSLNDSLDES
jgi:hypothetical protein